jgi:preprotein translocase subunit SecD
VDFGAEGRERMNRATSRAIRKRLVFVSDTQLDQISNSPVQISEAPAIATPLIGASVGSLSVD